MRQLTRWDLCRFVKTLAYFGVLPSLGLPVSGWLQERLGVTPQTDKAIAMTAPTVYVQADGSLAAALEQALTQRGYRPEALTADRPSQSPGAIAGTIRAVWANRGEDWTMSQQPQSMSRVLFDFRQPMDLSQIWGAVDDVVMGGVSQSGIERVATGALFSGVVSTENSGGFASVRTRNLDPIDLSAYSGVRLRVRGDGNRYKVLLRDSDRWDGVGYSMSFDTVPNSWITVQVPFEELVPVFRARTLEASEGLNQSSVRAFQLMLSKFEYDGTLNPTFTPGAFELLIESIEAYGEGPAPTVWLRSQAAPELGRPLESFETVLRVAALVNQGDRAFTLRTDGASGALPVATAAALCVRILETPTLQGRDVAVQAGSGPGLEDWAQSIAGIS